MRKTLLVMVFASAMIMANTANADCTPGNGNCGDNCTYTIDTNCHLIVQGPITKGQTGAIDTDVFMYNSNIKSAEIQGNITSIGELAFAGATGLTSVVLPDSLTSIEYYAFDGASSLTSVNFGKNSQLTSIGELAFAGATGLTSIEIPSSVTRIGTNAFDGASSLTSVNFGENSQLTSIGEFAFYGTGLTSIKIPNSVTSIEGYAFSGASSLTSIEIPNSVTSIGDSAFEGTGLTSVVIPDSVTSISIGAFNGAENLTDITIPDTLFLGRLTRVDDEVHGKDDLERGYKAGFYEKAFYDLAKAFFEENPEADYFEGSYYTYKTIFGGLDLSKVTIHCSGDINKCKANMAAAGYEKGTYTLTQVTPKSTSTRIELADGSTKVIDADGKVHFEGKRIYTIDEANLVAKSTGNTVKIRYR